MKPRFPIYIPSYSRWQKSRALTVKSLEEMGLTYTLIVEPEQYDIYVDIFGKKKVKALPPEYHENYETLDDLGMSKSQGPGPARNFAWDDSIKRGYDWHWVMDDNIDGFYRYHKNMRYKVIDPVFFRIMEDFVLRYENIGMAGPNYVMFVPDIQKVKPIILNTRIYSCNLIRNSLPYRWRGRYNEDTILSLDMLLDGWVTVQFNALLQNKINTQTIPGGNHERFYSVEGTYPKSVMLKQAFPDLVKVVWKFGRWHHHVNYAPFKKNKLIRKKDLIIPDKDTYPMKLINKKTGIPIDKSPSVRRD